jgi:alpha-beta hydrolase superfamily lysophospholipase
LLAKSLEWFPYSDGYRGYVHVFKPSINTRARVIFLHGIRSHAGWYQRTLSTLAHEGYEVYALDRRGSGWNTAHRGDVPSVQRWRDDVYEVIQAARLRQSSLPTILLGVSWGGKLALSCAGTWPGLIQGVAMIAPGLVPRVQLPLAKRLRIALASRLRPTRTFPIPLNDPELFTSNREAQEFIRDQPHDLHEATARFLVQSVRLDWQTRRSAKNVRADVLLMLAEQDQILDNARTRAYLHNLIRARSITVRDYPGTHHTLEFESPEHLWTADLRAWLGQFA